MNSMERMDSVKVPYKSLNLLILGYGPRLELSSDLVYFIWLPVTWLFYIQPVLVEDTFDVKINK